MDFKLNADHAVVGKKSVLEGTAAACLYLPFFSNKFALLVTLTFNVRKMNR